MSALIVFSIAQKPPEHEVHLLWVLAVLAAGVTVMGIRLFLVRSHPEPGRVAAPLTVDQILDIQRTSAYGIRHKEPWPNIDKPDRHVKEPGAKEGHWISSPCKGCGNADVRMETSGYCVTCVGAGAAPPLPPPVDGEAIADALA